MTSDAIALDHNTDANELLNAAFLIRWSSLETGDYILSPVEKVCDFRPGSTLTIPQPGQPGWRPFRIRPEKRVILATIESVTRLQFYEGCGRQSCWPREQFYKLWNLYYGPLDPEQLRSDRAPSIYATRLVDLIRTTLYSPEWHKYINAHMPLKVSLKFT